MAYESVEKLLDSKEQKPWEYNFEFECDDAEYKWLKTFERYFTYKASSPKGCDYPHAAAFRADSAKKYKDLKDPDGSGYEFYELTHDIYSALWNWKKNDGNTFGTINRRFGDTFSDLGCDTMNSVQTVLNSLYVLDKAGVKLEGRRNVSENYMLECMQTVPDFCKNFLSEIGMSGVAKQYIDVYHTIGNFVLVPAGFNRYRAWHFGDYWDLSLENLKVTQIGDSFNWYINYFFLWDYVKTVGNQYEVRGISPRDRNDTAEFDRFFYHTISFIKRRGMFMTAMLMIRQSDPKLYDELLFTLNSSIIYGGLWEVAEMFLSQSGSGIPDGAKAILEKLTRRLLTLDEIIEECRKDNAVEFVFVGNDEEQDSLLYELVTLQPDGTAKREIILTNEDMDAIGFALDEDYALD